MRQSIMFIWIIQKKILFHCRFLNFSKPLSQIVAMVPCFDWKNLETSVMLHLDTFAGFVIESCAIPSRITEKTRLWSQLCRV